MSNRRLRITSLNVCGLRSKTIFPEFHEFTSAYDIIGFQETKTDQLDDLTLTGFILKFKHRNNLAKRRSGGIALAYKKELGHFITVIDSPSKLVLWFTISKRLTKSIDLLCGIIYIPPEGSDYSANFPYQDIECELYAHTDKYQNILLFGDFNSRTKNLPDIIEIDPYICTRFNSQELSIEYETEMSYFDNNNTRISFQRTNKDTNMNNYGYRMLDFCKCNNLYILNGRTAKDKDKGICTCKGVSTIDYFLCSSQIIPLINDFYVNDFSQILSDAHCPVSLEIKLQLPCEQEHVNNHSSSDESKRVKLWDETLKDEFLYNIDLNAFDKINENISCLRLERNITQNDIDCIVESFNKVIITSAEKSFGTYKISDQSNASSKPLSWFGRKCTKARKQFHTARFQYKLRKSFENKERLKTASKSYKYIVKSSHTKFQQNNIANIRSLKYCNPKKYWKLLNGKKKDSVAAEAESLFQHFKNINFDENLENMPTNISSTDMVNEEINEPFTEDEIRNAIKSLKNNKASGIDLILNEQLKILSHMISPILVNLFNLVFDTGIIPEAWTLGMIQPIFKNKGNASDPSNYRPITLISCLGKVFTQILNNRIQKYADENDIITHCQSGFRKKYSTTDNIFILHNLIDLVCKSKKSVFCSFIDLKQAFDRVWREGLWEKLSVYHINGKCLKIIQSIYRNIKSCVIVNNNKTDFFLSNIGVRQGENLSPFLFNIFLNDLDFFFRENDAL